MPWNPKIPPDVRTVHLGEFLPEHAARIGDELNARGIAWWTKDPGAISRIWQLGIEMFVDRDRLEEAVQVAANVSADPRPSEP